MSKNFVRAPLASFPLFCCRREIDCHIPPHRRRRPTSAISAFRTSSRTRVTYFASRFKFTVAEQYLPSAHTHRHVNSRKRINNFPTVCVHCGRVEVEKTRRRFLSVFRRRWREGGGGEGDNNNGCHGRLNFRIYIGFAIEPNLLKEKNKYRHRTRVYIASVSIS